MLFFNLTFSNKTALSADVHNSKHQTVILAGGCFWGVENLFSKLEGVSETQVGYTGGTIDNPNYEIVKTGLSGHAESVKIIFDPQKISFEKIIKYFFTIHDPTQLNRQQNDIGSQYASIIFYTSDLQKEIAQQVILEASNKKIFAKPIVTQIVKASKFYRAEDYHQKYLQKNPNGYNCHYQRQEWIF